MVDEVAPTLGLSDAFVRRLHDELTARHRRDLEDGDSSAGSHGPVLDAPESRDPLPSIKVLSQLLNTCYQATLTRDEGRATVFRLTYVRRDVALDGDRVAFVLAEPIPLSVGAIRRLAPAAASRYLAVEEVDGVAELWGLISELEPESGRPRLPGLTLFGSGPGHLSLTTMRSAVLMITPEGGVQILKDRRPEDFDFASVLGGALEIHGRDGMMASHLLLRIGLALRRPGHGGTLLIAAHPSTDWPIREIRHRISVDSTNLLGDRLEKLIAQTVEGTVHPDAWELSGNPDDYGGGALDDPIRMIAAMAAIDGAVLMTASLSVLGFGVFIDTAGFDTAAKVVVLDALDPTATRRDTVPLLELGGARHQSAAAFVNAFPGGGVALVASQDGLLTMIFKTAEEGIIAWRPVLPMLR